MQNDRKPRRRHSAQLKSQVLRECAEAGASVAGIALAHGLNANLVRQWLRGRGIKRADTVAALPASASAPRKMALQQFVPVALPASKTVAPADVQPAAIRVEVHRGPFRVQVSWPQCDGAQCAAWLRELLR